MIQIRKMEEKDTTIVFQMMREFYNSDAVIHTAPDHILKKDIADAISDLPLLDGFVFEDNNKLVGYAMTAMNYTTEYGGICIWLEDLYLLPEIRGLGFSKDFFAFLEKQYPQAVRFKLEVEPENEMAIASYKKNGYTVSPYFEMTKEMI